MTLSRGITLCTFALAMGAACAFAPSAGGPWKSRAGPELSMAAGGDGSDRRSFLGNAASGLILPSLVSSGLVGGAQPASAKLFLDPAMYGDQELRQSAVNSLKEAARRAILQDPGLAPAFFQLALLDGLSYDPVSEDYGPDGRVFAAVLASKDSSENAMLLKAAANILLQSCQNLKKLTSITPGDAAALGGAAAIESIGGPFLSIQLGRLEPANKKDYNKGIDLSLFSGSASPTTVKAAFLKAGLTEREMTALLSTLLTIETVRKTRSTEDWKKSARPKFREAGKMGRASEFKPLTEEDIADLEDEERADDGWYIADSFGTRDQSFGAKIGDDLTEKNFNKFIKEMYDGNMKKPLTAAAAEEKYGWTTSILLDKQNPVTETWVKKYAGSYLSYNKDLQVAYNAVTQLGADYTGGKYESLLKNKKRKTLNDFD